MGDCRVRGAAGEDACCKSRGRRRGLDSEPALPRAPEEGPDFWIEAVNRDAVRSETSKARPAPLDRFHGPIDDLLEPVDCQGDVDFFWRSIAWVALDLVVRAEPDAPIAFALEIESAVGVIDKRKLSKTRSPDSKLHHRPSLRRNAKRPDPAGARNRVGPCSGGVDDEPRLDRRSIGQADCPSSIAEHRAVERGVRCDLPSQFPEAADDGAAEGRPFRTPRSSAGR